LADPKTTCSTDKINEDELIKKMKLMEKTSQFNSLTSLSLKLNYMGVSLR
jgi:hypothetical protein